MVGIRDKSKKQLFVDCFHMNETQSKSKFDKAIRKLDNRRNSITHESDRDILSFERKPITDDEVQELIHDINVIDVNIIKMVRGNLSAATGVDD